MRTAALLALLALCGACTPTFTGRLRTRDPLEGGKLETYRSGSIVLGTGDVDVVTPSGTRPPLLQGAWFEVYSADEIRFHVTLSHKWEEMADLANCRVKLVTNRGDTLAPARTWNHRNITQQHEVAVGQVKAGPTAYSAPSYTEETFRTDLHGADAVIVFKAPGLVSKAVRSYALYIDHPRRRLRFIWDVVPKAELGDDE